MCDQSIFLGKNVCNNFKGYKISLLKIPVEIIWSLVAASSSGRLQRLLSQETEQLLEQELPHSQLFLLLYEGHIYFPTSPQPLQ